MSKQLESHREKTRKAKKLKSPDLSKCTKHHIPSKRMWVYLRPGQSIEKFLELLDDRKLRV